MTKEEIDELKKSDADGLRIYEYIANSIGQGDDTDLQPLAEALRDVDITGQFTASAARFINAIDAVRYADVVRLLVAATIDRDRDRAFLGDLMQSIYGPDHMDRARELCESDNNFRRMYKRLHNSDPM